MDDSQLKRLESNEAAKALIFRKLYELGWNYHEIDYYVTTKVIEIFKIDEIENKKYLHVKSGRGSHWPIHFGHSQTMQSNFYYVLTATNSEDVYILPSLDACIIMEEEHANYLKNCKEKGIPPSDGIHRELRFIYPEALDVKYKNNYALLEG